MLSKNLSQLIFLSVFSIVVLSCLGCGEEEAILVTSGDWSLESATIEDGCAVYQSVLEELTVGDGSTKTLTFSEDQKSITMTDDNGTLNCTMSNAQFTCELTDEMIATFTEQQLIREDVISQAPYNGTVTRTVVIGGSFDSSTTGKLTFDLSVTCEGEKCPPQVQMTGFGTVSIPCSSGVSTPITTP